MRTRILELLARRGLINRLFGARLRRFVAHSWQEYPLGLLFGLGFDTASEVAVEIVHLSYKRTTIGEAAKPIECEVMAADIGKCLHTFVERVPSELLAEGFDAGWQGDASIFLAVGGPIFVATASLQDPKLVTAWTAAAPDAP